MGLEKIIRIFYENIAIKFTTGSSSQCGQMDITGDEIVNVVDLVALVNLILSDAEIDDMILCTYDLTGDNIINVIDIVLLVNYILE